MENNHLLDIFDYDLDIDFETAYEMINNEDQLKARVHHNNHMGGTMDVDHWSTSDGRGKLREGESLPLSIRMDDIQDHHSRLSGFESTSLLSYHNGHNHHDQSGLLSEVESSAIESFLDSLIYNGVRPNKHPRVSDHKPIVTESRTSENRESIMPKSIFTAMGSHQGSDDAKAVITTLETGQSNVRSPVPSRGHSEDNRTSESFTPGVYCSGLETLENQKLPLSKCASYQPAAIKSPDIVILDSEIPTDIRGDAAKCKRWKHVALEKKRRNAIKDYFDDLVKLIQFPRSAIDEAQSFYLINEKADAEGPAKKKSKDGKLSEKRIPKHVLLNYLLQDMDVLLTANQRMEAMLQS
ncbi:LADA_0F02960g1_1 [Lachancea dasiensis]|uniref:LADA_0F02960g1_1 n=1 Tax=Lachancea dasiensis TaxID=1072105 RepID=A0A1G4JIR6_9SACH|nr:LADA_0F02960g1_1 [Lachancea dasiensis]